MASAKRKMMFLFFILLFVVMASLVIFYAQGYRLRLSWPLNLNETLQKTGMLVLKTEPKEARIYINNSFQSYLSNKITSRKDKEYTQTPAKIKYLLPGKYKITVKKEGYWTWEKDVVIEPGKQTRLENVRLFKKTLPRRIAEAPLQNIHLSLHKKKAILEKDEKLLDLNKETARRIPRQEENVDKNMAGEISWSPNSRFFTIGSRLYNTEHLDFVTDIKKEEGEKIDNIKWKNNSVLQYRADKNILKEYNIDSKDHSIVLKTEKEILDYTNISEYVHVVVKNEKEVKYRILPQNGSKTIREIELPYSSEYSFINRDHFLVNLYDKINGSLYLIEPYALFSPIRDHIKEVKYTEWKDDRNLLCANDFEIWNYNIDDNNKNLITRISRPIIGIDKPFEQNYVIFYTEKNINILERREGEADNTTELIKLDEIRSPSFDKGENVIYFNAEIGKETGVYKLQI